MELFSRTDQTGGPDHQRRDTGRSENNNACPECGGLENGSSADSEDVFPDDEFICPACCCGMYIEVKE